MRTSTKIRLWTGLVALAIALAPAAARAETEVVGAAVADSAGAGSFDIPVDPEMDPGAVADELRASLELSSGADVTSITVENGIAHVEFANAAAGATVEATLPAEVASLLGVTTEGGVSTAAVGAGVGAAALGGGLGGAAAAGAFDGDDELPMTGER